ncbi:MAG: archease [Anaerolineae bacterium]
MTRRFEEIPHTADLAIRVYGRDLRELFTNAACGLFSLMAELPAEESVRREITLEGSDYETLLVDWLNELIYLHEVEGETYSHFAIETLSPRGLKTRVAGGPTIRKTRAIKAATFHDLSIEETPEGYVATVVFDV